MFLQKHGKNLSELGHCPRSAHALLACAACRRARVLLVWPATPSRLSFPSRNIPLRTCNSLFMAFAALPLLNEWQGIAPMSGAT